MSRGGGTPSSPTQARASRALASHSASTFEHARARGRQSGRGLSSIAFDDQRPRRPPPLDRDDAEGRGAEGRECEAGARDGDE